MVTFFLSVYLFVTFDFRNCIVPLAESYSILRKPGPIEINIKILLVHLSLSFALWTKTLICGFFLSYLLYQLRFGLVKYISQNDLSSVKDTHIVGKKNWPDMVVKRPFISCYFLRVSQAYARPPSTSEAITFEPIKM